MSQENKISAEQTFMQLAIAKRRLETYPFSHHEMKTVRDCLIVMIRTFAGEIIPPSQLASIGGGIMQAQPTDQGITDTSFGGGQMRTGGVETAPGCVQFDAVIQAAPIDVTLQGPPVAPVLNTIKPVAGSLMAMALEPEEKTDEIEAEQDKSEESSMGGLYNGSAQYSVKPSAFMCSSSSKTKTSEAVALVPCPK